LARPIATPNELDDRPARRQVRRCPAPTPHRLPARPAEVPEAVRRRQRHPLLVAGADENLTLATLHRGVEKAHHLRMVANQALCHLNRSLRPSREAARRHRPARARSRLDPASPALHTPRVGAILARFSRPGNQKSVTVTSQGRLTSADHEQLCDGDRESDAKQHEPDLNHAPTSPQTGLRAPRATCTDHMTRCITTPSRRAPQSSRSHNIRPIRQASTLYLGP
jgi:hypothetical protein